MMVKRLRRNPESTQRFNRLFLMIIFFLNGWTKTGTLFAILQSTFKSNK
jgi:hypothetical protein